MSEITAVTALTEEEAQRLTKRIQLRLVTIADNFEAVMPMIRQAIEGQAHLALGYSGVSAYITERFGQTLSRLGVEVRREVIRELGQAGLSTRAIAPVVGVSHKTVVKDLQVVRQVVPRVPPAETSHVVGLDGKSYASTQPSRVDRETGGLVEASGPMRKPRRRPFRKAYESAVWEVQKAVDRMERLHADDRLWDHVDEFERWTRQLADLQDRLFAVSDELHLHLESLADAGEGE